MEKMQHCAHPGMLFGVLHRVYGNAKLALWYIADNNPVLDSRELLVGLGGWLKHCGGKLNWHHLNLPKYDDARAAHNHFETCFQQECAKRLPEMYPKWDPVRKVPVQTTNWDVLGTTYDAMNSILQWSAEQLPRMLSTLRHTHASVHAKGSWIYVIWCPGSRKCYVAQCGARDTFRTVLERMRDHFLLARDWILSSSKPIARRAKYPLYEWWARMELHRVQITVVEQVPQWRADIKEIEWMHKFPRSDLLNVYIPDLRRDRWTCVLRMKAWKKVQPEHTRSLSDRAHKFIASLRSDLSVTGKYDLIMQTKRFLDAETARQVFTKAQQHIQRDTGVLIIPSFVLKIPLLTPDLRRKLAHVMKYSLLTTPDLPPIYAEYLCSILSFVSLRTKTAADLLCTHKMSFPMGCGVLGRGAEPLVRTQFLEHPPTLNFGGNHLKRWIQHPQKPPIPFLSPHNPHCRGGFLGGGQRVRAQLEQS